MSTSTTTPNMAAVLPSPRADLVVQEQPIPTPGPGELLIRNHAVALSPSDWKRQAFDIMIPSYPTILGADLAGTVVSVGDSSDGSHQFSPGDRVFSAAPGFATGLPSNGAHQTYTVVKTSTTSPLPSDMTFLQGAVQPTALGTATVGIVDILGLPLPGIPASLLKTKAAVGIDDKILLVWGGASTVGSTTIQLARIAGLSVIATASPAHHDKLRSIGAAAVVDYRSPTAVDEILAAAAGLGKKIAFAVDTISLPHTLGPVSQVLARSGVPTTRLAHTLPWPSGLAVPEGVEAGNIAMETVWGPREDLAQWIYQVAAPEWFTTGKVEPVGYRLVSGGLAGIQNGLDELRGGKVSGEKLVVEV
ncbi:chaperonin 10-like protein [Echria macrotheca]|uniref:Chaperonin 10-like protein n=1 Tax=Echria macrotheca TaxID=438768 RepID=A0AAJ0B9R3_9PEZI|nr:chaperonin 10-like protein [Echria macrotheca]